MVKHWAGVLAVAEFFRPRRPEPDEPEEEEPPLVQFRDTSYTPNAPVKSSHRFLPGFLVALAGLVILLASLFLPWYSYTISGKAWIGNVYYDVYDRSDYSFTDIRTIEERSVPGITVTNTSSRNWSEYEKHYTDAHHKAPKLPGVYSGTLLFLVAAVTLCALGAFLAAIFRMRKRPLLFPAIILLIGALVAMAGAGAFSSWHQPAVDNDRTELHVPDYPTSQSSLGPYESFWGESSRAPLTYEWGPSTGWYLAMAGPAMLIAGAVLMYAMNRGKNG